MTIKKARPRSSNFDLLNRTVAENLWLWRHRNSSSEPPDERAARGRHAGSMTQPEMAEQIGISVIQYIKLESAEGTLLDAEAVAALVNWPGWHELDDELTPTQLCLLARRRSGLDRGDIAKMLGISITTYTKWEDAGNTHALDFWIKQGYRFEQGPLKKAS